MIRVQGLQKSYADVGEALHILKGVDLEVGAGEIVVIMGVSGAGKSTLLNLLGGLDRPDSGSIHYDDTVLGSLRADQLSDFRNRHIGFVFQFHHLMPEFSVIENVMMPGWIMGKDTDRIQERARRLLGDVGLGERLAHRPNEISGGECQRVAVARALMNEPGVVLADEPSGNLDRGNSEMLHHLLRRLCDSQGQTFVVATHNEHLASVADRVLYLSGGILERENG